MSRKQNLWLNECLYHEHLLHHSWQCLNVCVLVVCWIEEKKNKKIEVDSLQDASTQLHYPLFRAFSPIDVSTEVVLLLALVDDECVCECNCECKYECDVMPVTVNPDDVAAAELN